MALWDAKETRGKDSVFNVRIAFVLILSNLSLYVLTSVGLSSFIRHLPAPPRKFMVCVVISVFTWHFLHVLVSGHERWDSMEYVLGHTQSVCWDTECQFHHRAPGACVPKCIIALTGMSAWQTLVSHHSFSCHRAKISPVWVMASGCQREGRATKEKQGSMVSLQVATSA